MPPSIPPEIEDRLRELEKCCDPAAEEERHRGLERGLECITIDACALGIRIAGVLAECWLKTHSPLPAGISGVYAGWNNPEPILARLRACSPETTAGGQQQAYAPRPIDWQGDWKGSSGDYAAPCLRGSAIALAWGNKQGVSANLPGAELIQSRSYVFASPDEQREPGLQYRSVALREGEGDPCTSEEAI